MLADLQLPDSNIPGLCGMEKKADCFVLHLQSKLQHWICPECGTKSTRIYSTYTRKLLDLPWTGEPVRGLVRIRKIYCSNPACHRKIFAERLGKELEPYARRTGRLNKHLNAIGLALEGNAGSRLASRGLGLESQVQYRLQTVGIYCRTLGMPSRECWTSTTRNSVCLRKILLKRS